MRSSRHVKGDRGASGVMLVGIISGLMALILALVGAVTVVVRVTRVQNAVDSVALEAADIASGRLSGGPCSEASALVAMSGGALESCGIEGTDSRVTATVFSGVFRFTVRAHAGQHAGSGNFF